MAIFGEAVRNQSRYLPDITPGRPKTRMPNGRTGMAAPPKSLKPPRTSENRILATYCCGPPPSAAYKSTWFTTFARRSRTSSCCDT